MQHCWRLLSLFVVLLASTGCQKASQGNGTAGQLPSTDSIATVTAAAPEQEPVIATTTPAELAAPPPNYEYQLQAALANGLAAEARATLLAQPQLATLLAIEAWRLQANGTTRDALMQVLEQGSGIGLSGHTAGIVDIELSSDGRWIVSASQDGTVRLWDATLANPGAAPIVLLSQSQQITDVAIDPKGQWLAVSSWDTPIQLWDLDAIETNGEPSLLAAANVQGLTFTPDGRSLVFSGYQSLIVLPVDGTAGQQLEAPTENGQLSAPLITPNGQWLISADDKAVLLWDLATTAGVPNGAYLPGIENPDRSGNLFPHKLTLSPNGRWLAAGVYDGTNSAAVLLWDLNSTIWPPEPRIMVEHLPSSISAIAFSQDSDRLAIAYLNGDSEIYVWRLSEPDPLILNSHHATVFTLAFAPDGDYLLSGTVDNLVRIWPLNSSRPDQPTPIRIFEGPVGYLAFNAAGFLVGATRPQWTSEDHTLRLWRWQDPEKLHGLPLVVAQPRNWITDVFSSNAGPWIVVVDQHLCDGESCIPNGDATITLWPADSSGENQTGLTLLETEAWQSEVVISDDGQWLASGGEDGIITLWDLTAPDPRQTERQLTGHQGEITRLEFALESGHLISRAASGHNTGSLSIWNLSDGNHHTIEYPARQQSRFTLSENGRWLYGQYVVPDTNSAEILVWDLQQLSSDMAPDRVLTFEIDAASYSAVISPDQKWLAVATGWPGYHVFLYDLTKESLLPIELTAYKQEFAGIHGTYLRFSADSRWLTFGHHQVDTIPMLWDLDSENPVASGQKLDCYGGNLLGTSQDGRWLVTSNRQGATCLWDMSDPGQSLDPIFLYDQQGAAEQIAFSPDNQWLAVASEGKQVSIWQLTADNIHLSYLSLSQIGLRNLTFGMDSQLLYTYSFGQLNAWPLNLGDWLGVACQIAGRNLTQQEWYRYFDTEPYRQTCP